MNEPKDRQYDAIVIGSGMGGLATASLLAQLGKKRVLVLEKHFKLGGFTHSFRRQQYSWDVGLHYVGEMYEGAFLRKMMDLVTGGGLEWQSLGKTVERVCLGEQVFEYPDNPEELKARLQELFPQERAKLERYFKDVKRVQNWMARWFVSKAYPTAIAKLLTAYSRSLALRNTSEYLDRFADPRLKSMLAAQWPDFGTPPEQSAFGFHGLITADYFHGGYYPIGGAQKIAEQCRRLIEGAGGSCRVNHAVTQVITDDGRAIGVCVENKRNSQEFYAPVIVSAAGAAATFERFIPEAFCAKERQQVRRSVRGVSALVLFLGLNRDPREWGFDAANYWLYDELATSGLAASDFAKRDDGAVSGVDSNSLERLPLSPAFLSFGSCRDPQAKSHVAQIICFTDGSGWEKYSGQGWMHRSEEYARIKQTLSERMLAIVESRYPGFRSMVAYCELGTPLTVESFASHPSGMIYGQRCDRERLGESQWRVKTSLPGLYLSGSDVGTPGINGALMGGVVTAAKLLGAAGFPRILAAASRRR